MGGFAFGEDGGAESHWSSLPPALLFMPRVSIARVEGRCNLTLSAVLEPGADPEAERATLEARLAGLGDDPLPMLDPSPGTGTRVRSAKPPGDFEHAVERAVERIRPGDFEKVVLAREVEVEGGAAHDTAALYGAIRDLFPACFCFCVGTPEAAFVGASPELLVRRSGAVAATVALAGSTRRSADPAVDDHLGEQLLRSEKDRHEHEIVATRIERTLRPHSVWVEPAETPGWSPSPTSSISLPRSTPSSPSPAPRQSLRRFCIPPPRSAASLARRPFPRSPSSREWTAAGTRARSAGWMPPRTASSASRSAAP